MIRQRYRRIVFFFARILLGFLWWDILLPRAGLRAAALRTRPERLRRSARSLRTLAIQMGGVLIKVGQFLSTRVDVLPPEFTGELQGLQDEVPAESFAAVRVVAEQELGGPLAEKFEAFDERPLAAASLGQVHRARLFAHAAGGEECNIQEVVVKIQRPNIEKIIATDLSALRTVGDWLSRYPPIRRRADVLALLAEFTTILYQEIDYQAEGRNAETFAANFQDDARVHVPRVIWSHSTRRTLTLENVWAIKITDYEAISAAGIDRAQVAATLLDSYLKQIFEDGFFHADPHPGNLFVTPNGAGTDGAGPDGWRLTFVDFGMVGHVPEKMLQGLREMLFAVGTQDAARIVRAYQIMGVLLPSADLELLERAEAEAFRRFWGKNMSELQRLGAQEIREFAAEFQALIYTLPFQIPQDFIFLARAVGILSGMCTGLDPKFNVWEHLAPYARKLMSAEARPAAEAWLEQLGNLARSMLNVPVKMDQILNKLESGQVAVKSPELVRQVEQLKVAARQVTGGVVFAALLLGAVQLYLGGAVELGLALAGAAALSLAWLLTRKT